MNQLTDIFDLKTLQNALAVMTILERDGVEFSDQRDTLKSIIVSHANLMLKKRVEAYKETQKSNTAYFDKAPLCPSCSSKLALKSIRTPEGIGNVNGYKSHFICDSCLHEEYSILSVESQLVKLGVQM